MDLESLHKILDKSRWERVLFGKVVTNINQNERKPLEKGITRFIGLEHIEPGNIKIKNWGNVKAGTTFTKVFRKGQLLFGKRRAYLKKLAIADFDGVCSGDILVLEAKPEKLLPCILPYVVQNDAFFQHAVRTSAGSLSPRTKWKDIASFEFYLPKLKEQKLIADTLYKIEDVIEQTKRQEQALVQYRKGIINVIFNQSDDWGNILPKTKKKKITLGNVVINLNKTERNPIENGLTKFIGLEHIEPENIKINNWGNVEAGTTFTKVFRKGQLLFGKRRAYLKKAAVADFDGICSGDILVFEAKPEKLLPCILPYVVQNDVFFQHAVTTSAGSLSPRTKWKDIASFEFYLPEIEIQQELLEVFNKFDNAIEQTRQHKAALRAFKKGLLAEWIE